MTLNDTHAFADNHGIVGGALVEQCLPCGL
jgi:hypothetical protein